MEKGGRKGRRKWGLAVEVGQQLSTRKKKTRRGPYEPHILSQRMKWKGS